MANEQEYQRFTMNVEIDEKSLREIYLKPFEMAIKSANPPKCVMTAYNCVNGQHMDMNTVLIRDVLREEWGFKGMVMSDWGGTNGTIESVLAGCDLEMPGPPEKRGKVLLSHLAENPSKELLKAIDTCCLRILSLIQSLKLLNLSPEAATQTRHQPETSSSTPEDKQLLRSVAADSIVLLKNSTNILPLSRSMLQGKKIALIGPNAKHGTPGGGGSATMNPQYQTQPLQALTIMLTEENIHAEVIYEPGALTHKWLPLVTPDRWSSPTSTQSEPLQIDFFSTPNFTGEVIETQHRTSSYLDLFDSAPSFFYSDSGNPHSLLITSTLTPSTSGLHTFEISSVGNSKLFVNGNLVIDNYAWTETGETFYSFGSVAERAFIPMVAGKKYEVRIEASTKVPETNITLGDKDPVHVFGVQPSVRLGFMEEVKSEEDLIADAVKAARDADVVVCVLGLNDEWESEGYDRSSMSLPGSQDKLIWSLLAKEGIKEKLVVVNQSGSPVHMPWADEAPSIVQAWYGGQEAGNALWDVLCGKVSPSGRLPVTWARKYGDLGFEGKKEKWPGVEGVVRYEEGTGVGYRWFFGEGKEEVPRWWFGWGLGYTTFEFSGLMLIKTEERWEVTVSIKNIGDREGREVVQVYSSSGGKVGSMRELRAFNKTDVLQPGKEVKISVEIKLQDLAAWDVETGHWVVEKGVCKILVGKHAGDEEMLEAEVIIEETSSWGP